MADKQNKIKRIGVIERKISDGEALLRRTNSASSLGWVFIVIGIIIIFFVGDFFVIVGLVIIGASILRLIKANKYRQEIEEGLREYRGQKAELQAEISSMD